MTILLSTTPWTSLLMCLNCPYSILFKEVCWLSLGGDIRTFFLVKGIGKTEQFDELLPPRISTLDYRAIIGQELCLVSECRTANRIRPGQVKIEVLETRN